MPLQGSSVSQSRPRAGSGTSLHRRRLPEGALLETATQVGSRLETRKTKAPIGLVGRISTSAWLQTWEIRIRGADLVMVLGCGGQSLYVMKRDQF